LPFMYHISGEISMWILLVCNLYMVYASVMLYIKMDIPAARKVMFSSYFYLMIVFLSLYANKWPTQNKSLGIQNNVEWKQR